MERGVDDEGEEEEKKRKNRTRARRTCLCFSSLLHPNSTLIAIAKHPRATQGLSRSPVEVLIYVRESGERAPGR